MVLFDIPLLPVMDDVWLVYYEGGEFSFPSRIAAITFAAERARDAARLGSVALLNIEGEDGRWRVFRPDLKAPIDAFGR